MDRPTDPLLAEYMTRYDTQESSEKTRRNASQAFVHFERFLAEEGITAAEAEHDDVATFLREMRKTLSVGTTRLYLGQVGAAYRYAMRRDRIRRDPTIDVLLPRRGDSEPRVFEPAELEAIRRAVGTTREDVLFHGLAYTGFRRMELRTLSRENVDFHRAQMTVIGKGSKLRHVPLHPRLADVLRPHFARGGRFALESTRGGPISDTTFDRTLVALLHRAGVPGTAHDFRKTVTTTMIEEGVRPDVADKLMGWAPRTVRDRYYTRTATEDLHAAILTLYPVPRRRRRAAGEDVAASEGVLTYPQLHLVRP